MSAECGPFDEALKMLTPDTSMIAMHGHDRQSAGKTGRNQTQLFWILEISHNLAGSFTCPGPLGRLIYGTQ